MPITITDPEMTRFMMSLPDAVDLVLFAFEHGNSGDLFVNKAPAGSIGDLAIALKELFVANNKIKIIGTRHGEKLYETLCTREEMIKAQDMGNFYRIPSDNRDLNYAQYFSEGEEDISKIEDYHSHNTTQLSINEMKKLLLKLPMIKSELNDGTFDDQNVDTHQAESLQLKLTNRVQSLNTNSDPSEIINAVGPLQTLNRLKQEGNTLLTFDQAKKQIENK
jgi:hypothetical protein